MPRLHDVTTTPDRPPEFRALERETANLRRDMRYPPVLATLQRSRYPRLRPLAVSLPSERLFELVQATALEMPRWEIAGVEAGRLQLEAVSGTSVPGLKMDVVVQVRTESEAGERSIVHLRCKSRWGGELFGAPARCIRAFLDRLEQKLHS